MKEADQHSPKDTKAGRKCSKTHSSFSSPARLCAKKQVFLHRRCSISSNTGTSLLLCLSQRRISLQKRPNIVSCDTFIYDQLPSQTTDPVIISCATEKRTTPESIRRSQSQTKRNISTLSTEKEAVASS